MEDDINAVKSLVQHGLITDVGLNKFGVAVEVTRSGISMNLRLEVVVDTDVVAFCYEAIYEMAADKPGSPGYQEFYIGS